MKLQGSVNELSFEKLITDIESNEKLKYLLEKIKTIEIQQDLVSTYSEIVSWDEIKLLAEWANILASSSKIDSRMNAFHIASSLPYITHSKGINISCIIALRKLGNFPAIKLIEGKAEIEEYKSFLGAIGSLEEYVFESLNSETFFEKEYLLTNFQKQVFDFIKESKGVSVSAPTSSGKSFIFSKILLGLIYSEKGTTAIYIVPTRALIRQVMNDFIDSINELNLKEIHIGCTSEFEDLIKYPNKSNILVLTQERLFQLCIKKDVNKLKTKVIVVDEAHNIESDARGVLLEEALKYAQFIWPSARILFSSPLISNPAKLLDIFNFKDSASASDVETFPLVRQNVIKVSRRGDELVIGTDFNNRYVEVLRIPFDYKGNSKVILLSKVASVLWNNQSSIIYASEPMLSTDIIRELTSSGQFPILNDERLNEFSDFIEEYICDNYELADFIRRGLAFHFSALPASIRAGIEDLFKVGALKIISCTSTLLEGLNMPAKNIFMYKPEKGKNKAIDKLNFWNLAGRAGRMGSDLVGNIICIEVEDWAEDPLGGSKLKSITSASEKRLVGEPEKIRDYIIDRGKPSGIDDYNEQLTSMIIRERIDGKRLIDSEYANDKNKSILGEIDYITEEIITDFNAPLEVITLCPGVLPDRINDLWNFFMSNRENIDIMMPLHPRDEGKNRFKQIVTNINLFLMNGNIQSQKHIDKIVMVGYRWMIGVPLSKIIFYQKTSVEKEPRKITKYVHDQIDFLNDSIRYKMVKYTQAYTHILKAFLNSIEKRVEADKVINISSYLEYGACDIPALVFMSLGLSREASIKLADVIPYKTIFTTQYCHNWLKEKDVDSLEMPNYLKKQIKAIQTIL